MTVSALNGQEFFQAITVTHSKYLSTLSQQAKTDDGKERNVENLGNK